MKMKKRYALFALAIIPILFLAATNTPVKAKLMFNIQAGVFDPSGDKEGFYSITIHDNSSGTAVAGSLTGWTSVVEVDYLDDTSPWTPIEIELDTELLFSVVVAINDSHAVYDTADDYTRVNMSLYNGTSWLWSNSTTGSAIATTDDSGYYLVQYLMFWYSSNATLPEAGLTYTAYFRDFVYY